jgi:hypothetical protein
MELGLEGTQLIGITATPAIAKAVDAVGAGLGCNAFQVGRDGRMLLNEVHSCSFRVRRGSHPEEIDPDEDFARRRMVISSSTSEPDPTARSPGAPGAV